MHAGKRFVVEVKSGDPVSAQQVRLGVGQLLEYRHLLDGSRPPAVQAVLIIEAGAPQAWETIAADVGVELLQADELDSSRRRHRRYRRSTITR
jgi:hypothetical protein